MEMGWKHRLDTKVINLSVTVIKVVNAALDKRSHAFKPEPQKEEIHPQFSIHKLTSKLMGG